MKEIINLKNLDQISCEQMNAIKKHVSPCSKAVKKKYSDRKVVLYSCYDVTNERVFRILIVGRANDTEDDIHKYICSVASSEKYNAQVRSCLSESLDFKYVDVRDLQMRGFVVVEVYEDRTFNEFTINDTSSRLLLAYPFYGKDSKDGVLRDLLSIYNLNSTSEIAETITENLRAGKVHKILKSGNLHVVSRALATFFNFNAFGIINSVNRLNNKSGNLKIRLDGRVLYYHPGKEADALFTGSDYDSESSFETSIMTITLSEKEIMSIICSINHLKKDEQILFLAMINLTAASPTFGLSRLFKELLVGLLEDSSINQCADHSLTVNGTTIEFVKNKA